MPMMRPNRACVGLTLCLCAAFASGQQLSAFNWTAQSMTSLNGRQPLVLDVYVSGRGKTLQTPVLPLTEPAFTQISPSTSLAGSPFVADPSNQAYIDPDNIVLISCDASDYGGNINALDVFSTVEQINATAVVFYSQHAQGCKLQNYTGAYTSVYSMLSHQDAVALVEQVGQVGTNAVYVTISQSGQLSGSNDGPPDSTQTSGPSGPTNGTNTAMIILYTITGIITAMFLAIIVTGGVRAHRHPERYGPRNVLGRPRQSRARGIAKAMLDSLPIVKFSDEQKSGLKVSEVELEAGRTQPRPVSSTADQTATVTVEPASQQEYRRGSLSSLASGDVGIAAASPAIFPANHTVPGDEEENSQGCSICTERFESGQDLRVLPCDHRYHPACIDPWLLNVSGTCPLCRADLRGEEGLEDNDGTVPATEGDLTGSQQPENSSPEIARSRRDTIFAMLGIRRSQHMTQEQRLQALRDYRAHMSAQRGRAGSTTRPSPAPAQSDATTHPS